MANGEARAPTKETESNLCNPQNFHMQETGEESLWNERKKEKLSRSF